jgi:large subunit ribosomal protein L32e
MTTEIKRLIRVRVEKGATFKRDGYGKKAQLSDSWRKPRGQHNKQREQKKAKGALPKPGFGSPVAVRGMHPSGFFEILVTSLKDLEGLDPKTHAVRLGATVGERKRMILQDTALASGIKVLNTRSVGIKETKPKKIDIKRVSAEKKKKDEKPAIKSKTPEAPVKKATKKAKVTPESDEKKTPAKTTKKPAKPKSEKAEKTPEKTGTTTPVKPAKKEAKPKTDAPVEPKPKAAAKPKTKKKTGSEVKKNE